MCIFLCCNPITNRWLNKALLGAGARSSSLCPKSDASDWFATQLPAEKQLGKKGTTSRESQTSIHVLPKKPRSVPKRDL
jgi:hypothetical protein